MKKFQNLLGAISILIGFIVVIMGIGEGSLFIALGIYMIVTREIIIGPMKEGE